MKSWLLGAQGRLGRCLQVEWPKAMPLSRTALDLLLPVAALRAQLQGVGPAALINAAAFTAVDAAESEFEAAQAINATACAVLGESARAWAQPLLHFSTEQVFDGLASRPYREDDAPTPANAYGRSKLGGEVALCASGCRALIVRSSWLYAADGESFVRSIWRAAQGEGELRVVNDQFGAPTSAHWLAAASLRIWRQWQQHDDATAVLHLNAAGRVSRAELAAFVLQVMREQGLPVRCSLVPVPTAAYPLPARRPPNGCLDTTLAATAYGQVAPPWEAGVREVLAQWRPT